MDAVKVTNANSTHTQLLIQYQLRICLFKGKRNYLISWTVARWTGSTRSILEISTDAVFGIVSGVWYMPAVCHTWQAPITHLIPTVKSVSTESVNEGMMTKTNKN